uniref:Tetratricopeptide repeat protein 19, mitochondrial n=1 Tax=Romanomermis culicivorax TaxID=13658 RepID=A0A915L858_ROMCU
MFRKIIRYYSRSRSHSHFHSIGPLKLGRGASVITECSLTSNRSYQRRNYDQTSNNRPLYAGTLITSIAVALGLKKPLLDDDEIKDQIKSSLMLINEQKFNEAENALHKTLALAGSKHNEGATNYVLDLMANLYYQMEKYEESIAIFTELMRRLMTSGTKKEDPAMIEVSLKLADMYARTGDDERAEIGFKFCVESANKNVENLEIDHETYSMKFKSIKTVEDDFGTKNRFSDHYALLGMVLETYSQFLITRHRSEEAEELVNRCLEISAFVYGSSRPHSVVLLNNFAVLLLDDAKYEKACHYLADVVNRAVHIQEFALELPQMMCNYAEALWHSGDREKAIEQAKTAANIAEEIDENTLEKCRRFLNDLLRDKTPTKTKT